MTKAEQDALLEYLEHTLVTMVEGYEVKLRGLIEPDAIAILYDGAYEVLNEMERSLAEVEEMRKA
jgi:hypothetical protein